MGVIPRKQFAAGVACAVLIALAAGACGSQNPAEPTRAATLAGVTPAVTPALVSTLVPGSPTALPSDLEVTWGEWWYEGEYLVSGEKYPADPEYHERSFNIRVTIRNASTQTLPGDVIPVFYLTDGEEERAVITWYYSPDDLRPLEPGEKKEAVFRALTYAPGQWIRRAEIRWRGQTWSAEFPKQ